MSTRPVLLVTGSRKGIGRYLAEYYVQKGYTVIGCSREATEYSNEHYRHFLTDVSDENSVKELFGVIRKEYGGLDVLINNAGVAAMNHALLTPGSTVQRLLNTNVLGTFLFCREAAKAMKKSGKGRIVNFVTVAVPLHLEGEAIYAASKAAVASLTTVLAREFADFGITVNAVGPTPIATDLIRGVSEAKITALVQRQAIRRLGTFQDVSNVIDFFIQPQSDFVTGQIVYLGGVNG